MRLFFNYYCPHKKFELIFFYFILIELTLIIKIKSYSHRKYSRLVYIYFESSEMPIELTDEEKNIRNLTYKLAKNKRV